MLRPELSILSLALGLLSRCCCLFSHYLKISVHCLCLPASASASAAAVVAAAAAALVLPLPQPLPLPACRHINMHIVKRRPFLAQSSSASASPSPVTCLESVTLELTLAYTNTCKHAHTLNSHTLHAVRNLFLGLFCLFPALCSVVIAYKAVLCIAFDLDAETFQLYT